VDERTRIDQQAREFFEGLWQRGDHWELESSAFEQMKYARILALLDGGHYPRVLELGCGAGTLTRHLASLADYVLALDIASGAIDCAQALWTGPATVDFPIGGFSPPEGRLARGCKPPAFSRFLFQSAVKSAESF
jgi:2-polyprenyl-3-methyl-5-hydroxy-6-metoxy-1,4-benzoquinol methylase